MEIKRIPTIIVNGFLEAGKTTYISECLKNDWFWKRGSTLLLLFEDGEAEYDEELLKSRNTVCESFPGNAGITEWVNEMLLKYHPDRVYIEGNAMIYDLYSKLPECLRVDFSVTLIDGSSLLLYYNNMRQLLSPIVTNAHQVVFNRCKQEALKPYANTFRLLNRKASYLWEAPSGYHEKAFGIMVPYDTGLDELEISETDYTAFCLDTQAEPLKYKGKIVRMVCQITRSEYDKDIILAGRRVMTCCAADIQFLGIRCNFIECASPEPNSWLRLEARCDVIQDSYGQNAFLLDVVSFTETVPPANLVIGM